MENETWQEEDEKPKERVTSLGWFLFLAFGSLFITLLGTVLFTEAYGYALYIGVPSMFGFIFGFLTPLRNVKSVTKVLVYTALLTIGLSFLLLFTGIEGGICIVMIAAPLFLFILGGYLFGHLIRKYNITGNSPILICFFLVNPTCMYVDTHQTMTEHAVSSVTVINAPAEKVWQVITQKVEYNIHPNMFFRLGVNYPKNMQLIQRNGSMFLSCELRNGNTDLWVTRLEKEKLMQFQLIQQIIPVKELTIYDSIDAPHSHPDYFRLNFGEFRLQPIDATHCKLVASSSFAYRLSPAVYWKWWSNYLVDKMHRHVIEVVKEKAEKNI